VLKIMLEAMPSLRYLMVHNVDTLGANLDAGLLGLHIAQGKTMTVEVISRRVEDRGGGLASLNGHVRPVEGMRCLMKKLNSSCPITTPTPSGSTSMVFCACQQRFVQWPHACRPILR
jgi:hypothetical protein